jgi:glutathione reductase (NADPH)
VAQDNYDLIVIGGGSGGLATARRAAQRGARVVLVEPDELGGTCVNRGCIPKKLLYNAASVKDTLLDASHYGFKAAPEELPFDFPQFLSGVRDYISMLNGVYGRNLDKEGVEVRRGHADLKSPHQVQVGEDCLSAPHIVIATGSQPVRPDLRGGELAITSDEFFSIRRPLRRVAIVGSGYIAVELAGVMSRLGSEVTLVIRGQEVLSRFDSTLRARLTEELSQDVNLVRNGNITALSGTRGAVTIELGDGPDHGPFDEVIWATGRAPRTEGLSSAPGGLESLGIRLAASGAILVNEFDETTLPGHYAVGDVTGRALLTPVAISAGRKLSERLFGSGGSDVVKYDLIPSVIFSHPPVGTVGLPEHLAREKYGDAVRVYEANFADTYQAFAHRRVRTSMKLLCVGPEERIVGLHVIGRGADEMLQGFAVALRMGACKSDFDATLAIHPTSAEEFVTMRRS